MEQQISLRRVHVAGLGAIILLGVAFLAGFAQPAQAFFRGYNEAFCAQMGDGIEDCSYYTWPQCRAAASGNGNFCYANPRYVPPEQRPPRKRKYRG